MRHVSENSVDISVGISGLQTSEGDAPPAESNKALLRAFTAISKALNLGRPLSDVLDLIAEKVSQTMGHKYCGILLANRETNELLMEGSFGLSEEYVRALNTDLKQLTDGDGPRSRSVTAQAYRTRMPVYAPDITVDPRFEAWREAALEAGYKSIVALPLVFQDEVIGVLNCYDEPRQYSEDQVEALMVVAEQAASAVGVARLIVEQRSTIDRLDSLNRHVLTQHAMLQRSERTHEALTALLLEDRSLDDITEALSGALGAPVVLQDERLRALSSFGSAETEYRGLPPDGCELARVEPLLSELRETGRAKSVKLKSEDPAGRTLLVAPVNLGAHAPGYLSIPLVSSEEEDFFLRALEQATTAYGLYMIRQRVAQETEDRIKGDLLADLLAARYRDEAEVRERARYLGLDFSRGPSRVLVVRYEPLTGYLPRRGWDVSRVGHLRGKLLSVARSFAAGAECGMAGADGERLVVVLPCLENEDPRRPADRLLGAMREEFPDLHARVGVSGPCAAPKDLADRYEETCSLLDLVESLGAVERTSCYDDWAVYGLLLRGSDKGDLLALAHRALDPLLEQEQAGQGDLLLTLQAYLDGNLSPTRTAKSLYVHPNTVKYRLKRISELLVLDLDRLDDVLTAKVALMVRRLDPKGFDSAIRRGAPPVGTDATSKHRGAAPE